MRSFWLVVLLPLIGAAQTAATKPKTVWDGVFNQAEVERGAAAYGTHCSRCHGDDLRRQGGVLIGAKFMERWREDNLHNLFTRIRDTMPPGQTGRLSEGDYVDIVAYVLSMNEFPSGTATLAPAEFERILIIAKDGPGPVPDFALVTVVGCLARDGAKGWMVTGASEPIALVILANLRSRKSRPPWRAPAGIALSIFWRRWSFPTSSRPGDG